MKYAWSGGNCVIVNGPIIKSWSAQAKLMMRIKIIYERERHKKQRLMWVSCCGALDAFI